MKRVVSEYKSINKIAILTIAGAMAIELTNFLLIPIMTRALGTSGYGTVSIYTAWCTIAIAVCGLQTTQAVVYIIADKEKDLQDRYLATMLSCSAACFISVLTAAVFITHIFGRSLDLTPVLVGLLFIQAFGNYCVNFARTIFTQRQQPEKQIALSVFVSVSTAVLSILLVNKIQNAEAKYYGRILGYAIPYAVCGLALLGYYFFPNIKKIRVSYVREYLPLCLPIIIHSLAAIVFSQSDRVMLGYIIGSEAAGIYSFTYSIASLLSVAWITLNSFFQPFFFNYLKNNDMKSIGSKTANLLTLYAAIYTVFLFVIPEAATIFGGEEFSSAVGYLPVLSLGVYFNFLYSFNSNFEMYYKETAIIAKGTLLSAVINVILNALLIPSYSIAGASVATLISFAALFVFHYLNAKRVAKKHSVEYVFSGKSFILWSSFAVVISLFAYLLQAYIIVRFILGGITAGLIMIKTVRQKSII